MNGLEQVRRLGQRAHHEPMPDIDVRAAVRARLASLTPTWDEALLAAVVRAWLALSATATVAAVVVGVAALQTWSNWSQPLAGLLRNAVVIMR